jgi:hypothetical protein
MSKFIPLGDRVLVRPDSNNEEKKSQGGLILTDSIQKELVFSLKMENVFQSQFKLVIKYYTPNKKQLTQLRLMVRNFLCSMNMNCWDTRDSE